IQEEREGDPPSRKGLAGSGLAARAREAFLGMARADPGRWLVVVNDDQPLWVLEQRIVDAVLARLEGREPTVEPIVPPGHALPPPEPTVEGLGERFFRLLDSLEAREPGLAAFLLSGLNGLPAHQRRLAMAERFPRLVARGLRGLDDEGSFALRHLLKEQAPVEVAMGLPKNSPRSMALREELFERAPKQVVEGLAGDSSEKAWALRDRALAKGALGPVLVSLAGDDSPRAWTLREVGFSSGLYDAVAESLVGLPGERAEAMREQLVPLDRLAALRALSEMDTPLATRLRQELVERAAKPVMRSLAGMATEHAFALREQVVERAPEALESLAGLDDERAWAMRERYAERWPSAVLGSLGTAGLCARGQALLARVLKACPDRLPVVRDAYALLLEAAEGPARSEQRTPVGVTARPSAEVSAP
ncbi:MAG TPA: hypothetical protein VK420_18245, partial [Longimicrobium sp.]|nr:hypothetical protein [Longimicrobium sp.]